MELTILLGYTALVILIDPIPVRLSHNYSTNECKHMQEFEIIEEEKKGEMRGNKKRRDQELLLLHNNWMYSGIIS